MKKIVLIFTILSLCLISTAKETTLTFEKGKMIEVAMFSIPSGKEQELKARYFSKAFPIAQECGLRHLGTFELVAETVSISVSDSKIYELFGGWLSKNGKPYLDSYFQDMMPTVMNEFGGQLALNLAVSNSLENYFLKPDLMGLMEWPSLEECHSITESEKFKEVGWKRANALSQLFVYQGTFNFPQEG